MNFKLFSFACSFVFLSFTSLTGLPIYILQDEGCLDRLEYTYTDKSGDKSNWVAYSAKPSATERVTLEIGEESQETLRNIPQGAITCTDTRFDRHLVNIVNSKKENVYIIQVNKRGRFTVSQVTSASYSTFTEQELGFYSPRYKLRLDRVDPVIGQNIAFQDPASKVYFEGGIPEGCTEGMIFRRYNANTETAGSSDIVIIPEIGIKEERGAGGSLFAQQEKRELTSVNGMRLERYLKILCSESSDESLVAAYDAPLDSDVPESFDYTSVPQPYFQGPPSVTPKGGNATTTPTTNTPATTTTTNVTPPSTHIVQKGETLWGISKKHGVAVSDIKAWNGLSSNIIKKGQALQVAPPPVTAPATPAAPSTTTAKGATATGVFVMRANTQTNPSPTVVTTPPATTNTTTASTSPSSPYRPQVITPTVSNPQPRTPNTYKRPANMPAPYDAPVGYNTTTSDQLTARSAGTATYYQVKSGETAAYIARKFGMTESALRKKNNIAPHEYIPVGTSLLISGTPANTTPAPPTSYSVPSQYNQDVLVPRSVNPSTTTTFGQTEIPTGYDTPASVPNSYNTNPVPTSYNTPTGQVSYSTAIPTEVNPTPPSPQQHGDLVPKGYDTPSSYEQQIAVPANHIVHQVKEGETLYGIARQYNIKVERLRQINGLERNEVIIPYQQLKIY